MHGISDRDISDLFPISPHNYTSVLKDTHNQGVFLEENKQKMTIAYRYFLSSSHFVK